MRPKEVLENQICRLALEWERRHAEYEKPATVTPAVADADAALAEAVRSYQAYLVKDALPEPEEDE